MGEEVAIPASREKRSNVWGEDVSRTVNFLLSIINSQSLVE